MCDQGLGMGWLMPICSFLGSRMPEILPVSRDVHMSLVTFRSLYLDLFWSVFRVIAIIASRKSPKIQIQREERHERHVHVT